MKTGVVVVIAVVSIIFIAVLGYLLYKYLNHHPFHIGHYEVGGTDKLSNFIHHYNPNSVSSMLHGTSSMLPNVHVSSGMIKQHASDAMHHLQMAHNMIRNINSRV